VEVCVYVCVRERARFCPRRKERKRERERERERKQINDIQSSWSIYERAAGVAAAAVVAHRLRHRDDRELEADALGRREDITQRKQG
jgi:uncharacterized protein (DUF4213/DUF364 family)